MKRLVVLEAIAIIASGCTPVISPQYADPGAMNRAPVVRVQDLTTTVGSDCEIAADGYDPDGDVLTYSWAGAFDAKGNPVRWVPSSEGTYTVEVTVSDGEMNASAQATIAVEPKPWQPSPGHVYFIDNATGAIMQDYSAADLGYSYAELWRLAWLMCDNHNMNNPGDPWSIVGGGAV